MEITQTRTDQVQIAYQVVDDNGDYPYMNTVVYPADAVPDEAGILAAIEADYAAWRAVMDTPPPEVTVETLQAELDRAEADHAAAEAKIAALTVSVAAAQQARDDELKPPPKG